MVSLYVGCVKVDAEVEHVSSLGCYIKVCFSQDFSDSHLTVELIKTFLGDLSVFHPAVRQRKAVQHLKPRVIGVSATELICLDKRIQPVVYNAHIGQRNVLNSKTLQLFVIKRELQM